MLDDLRLLVLQQMCLGLVLRQRGRSLGLRLWDGERDSNGSRWRPQGYWYVSLVGAEGCNRYACGGFLFWLKDAAGILARRRKRKFTDPS